MHLKKANFIYFLNLIFSFSAYYFYHKFLVYHRTKLINRFFDSKDLLLYIVDLKILV